MTSPVAISVIANLDDGYERDDTTGVVAADVELLIADFGTFTTDALIRFQSVDIPAGATILTCTMAVRSIAADADDPELAIHCEDVDDCPAIIESNGNISARARTTAFTAWSATSIGTSVVNTPDFSSALQEVIDRGGWAENQDIGVILDNTSSGGKVLNLEPFDNAGTDEAILNVTYSEGGGGIRNPFGGPMVLRNPLGA